MIIRIIPVGDLALSAEGDLIWETGPAYTRQRLAARFKFFLGEYFLDRRLGVPYFRHTFVKNPNLDTNRQMFRKIILSTPGVLGLSGDIELVYNPSARSMSVGFHATVEGGEVIVTPADADFIISLEAAA